MSWKERRLITVLSTILLILTIALIIVLAFRYRENQAEQDAVAMDPIAGIVTDQDVFSSLTYNNGSTTLSFERDDTGFWRWTADRNLPMDDSVILDILDLLTNWTPQQTLTDSAALEASGLSEPTGSLTAATKGGMYTKLLFGKTTTDGASRYVRLNEDESTVYIIDDELFTLMEIPVYDMCRLPSLPVLEESRIQAITLSGPEQEGETALLTSIMAQRSDDDPTTSWRANGANVTDDPIVKSLLEDLTALSFNKCIDYNPSDEAAAICGFDAPSAKLHISYVTESGTEQVLDLIIGNRLPDKTGRYARLEGDSTIYMLVSDLLDPLMRIAFDGLDG